MHRPLYLVYIWTNLHEILAPCLKSNFQTTICSTFLYHEEALTSSQTPPLGGQWGERVKKLGNGWSKSIVLENKAVLNFDLGMEPKNQDI